MTTYYIEYHSADGYTYCTYITASDRQEALRLFESIEDDFDRIIRCEAVL